MECGKIIVDDLDQFGTQIEFLGPDGRLVTRIQVSRKVAVRFELTDRVEPLPDVNPLAAGGALPIANRAAEVVAGVGSAAGNGTRE
jgi:hypothetical protein